MKLLSFGLFTTLLLVSVSSLAGTRDGGGGIGVRCPGTPLQLLDLHEAKRAGLSFSTDPLTREKAIAATSNLLTDHLWVRDYFDREEFFNGVVSIVTPMMDGKDFTDYATGTVDKINFVPVLPLSDDLGNTNVAAGCTLEQVAYFSDELSTLQIVESRWRELDWLSRSALITHELIYLFDRRQAIENFGLPHTGLTSEGARDFVGKLFSFNGVHSKFDLLPVGARYLECDSKEDPQSAFVVIDSGVQEVTVLIKGLYGMSSIFETVAKIPGTSVQDLWQYNGANAFDARVPLEFVDENRAPEFQLHLKKQAGNLAELEAFQMRGRQPVTLGAPQTITCELRN